MRRFLAGFLGAYLAVLFVTQPARAFAPVAVLAAPQIVTAGGGTYAMGALAGLVGLVGMYLEIKDAQDNGVRVPLSTANPTPPAPVAAPSITPETSTKYSWCASAPGGGAAWFSTVSDACTACVNQMSAEHPTRDFYLRSVSGTSCTYYYTDTGFPGWQSGDILGSVTPDTITSCPQGYVLSSGNCVLTNARQAVSDKKQDVQISGTGSGAKFQAMDDTDGSLTVSSTKAGVMIRGEGTAPKQAWIYGKDATGRNTATQVEINADGTQTYIRHYTEQKTELQTQVITTTATINASTGEVVSVGTQTQVGTIASPTTATAPQTTQTTTQTSPTAADTPTIQTSPTTQVIPSTQQTPQTVTVETCGLPGKPACNIDDSGFTDKAAGPTAAAAPISTNLDDIKTGLESSKDSKPTIDITWLPSLMPGTATACTAQQFSVGVSHGPMAGLSTTFDFDICGHLDTARQIIGYFLFLVTVFYVWRTFHRANEGG